jgi:predicted nucleic acid-binding protein
VNEDHAIGLDTGIFERVLRGQDRAVSLLRRLTDDDSLGYVSCISLYELKKLRHRGVVNHQQADFLLDRIPRAFEVVWLDRGAVLDRAAGLSHGNDIPMADALILASCLQRQCDRLYTTDADLTRYTGDDIDVVVIE